MRDFIRLDRLTVSGDVLRYDFSTSLDVFRKTSFFVEYDRPFAEPAESILTMPFAGVMMTVAWASGADLEMPSIDASFAESLERSSHYWMKCYPAWPFRSRLAARRVENRRDGNAGYGMLFSSGLDSLATYVRHRGKKPELFTVIGADFPHARADFATLCKERLFEDLARADGVTLRYIRTDIDETLDLKKLSRFAANWYGAVQHGLMLTSLVAPASHTYLKTLFMASCSHKRDYHFPCGSEPEVVRGLRWAGTAVEDDLHEMNRAQKVGAWLKPFPAYHKYLRVCWEQYDKINCSRCEKCLRTICELLLNNEDPNRYNFQVDAGTLEYLRRKLRDRYYLFFRGNEGLLNYWRAIRESIDLDRLEDRHGSKAFFEWLKAFRKLDRPQNPWLVSSWLRLLELRDSLRSALKNPTPAA
jgi:hypothetical protein